METLIKCFIENHRESLNRLIEGGKEKGEKRGNDRKRI